jgi:hypothetical protein
MTCIYYLHKGDNIPFYIGKTKNLSLRLYDHKHTYGRDVLIEEIDLVEDKEWKFWEKYWVEQFKIWGFKLKNKNNGGGGSLGGIPKPGTSQSHKGRISPNKGKGKKILQYSLEGKLLNIFESINEAIKCLNLNITHESIRICLKGKSNISAGFIWKYHTLNYLNQLPNKEVHDRNNPGYGPKGMKLNTGEKISKSLKGKSKSKEHIKKISKPVLQYSKDGKLLNIYGSITEAAKAVKGYDSNISNCCRDIKKTSSGYIWKYK